MLITTIEKYRITNEALLQTNKEQAEANRVKLNEFGSKINNIENNQLINKYSFYHNKNDTATPSKSSTRPPFEHLKYRPSNFNSSNVILPSL